MDEQDIQPTKRIITSKEELVSASPVDARQGYDPRIVPPGDLPDEIAHFHLYNFFDFNNDDKASDMKNDKLKVIREWAVKRGKTNDPMDMLSTLRGQETRMSVPPYGISRLHHLYQYAKLSLQADRLEEERESYLR